MLAISTSITGIDENIQRMKNIQLSLQDFQIGEIINYVCFLVQKDIQAGAPVRTGTLRDSVVHYMNNELSGEVAALAPYAYAVEYGYTAKNGKRIAGANFFRPPAMRGSKLLREELLKYTEKIVKGEKAKPPTASKGDRGSAVAHKYLYKVQTGAGVRYVYGKKSQTRTTFRPLLKPSPRKQPKSMFRAFRGGARRR